MSRATVRAGLVNWFDPATWQPTDHTLWFTKFLTTEPKIVQPSEFTAGEAKASAAVGWPSIVTETEQRVAVAGPTSGKKMIGYDIAVQIEFRSAQPDAAAAMDAYDELIENIKARIRSDRTFGGAFYQAGETGAVGGKSIDVTSRPAVLSGDLTVIESKVTFPVIEWITS